MLTYCFVCQFVLEQQCTVSRKLLFCGNYRCSGCQLYIAAAFIRAIPLFCTYAIGRGSRELVKGRAAVAVGAMRKDSILQEGATDTLLSEHSPAALRAHTTIMLSAGLQVCASTVCGTAS